MNKLLFNIIGSLALFRSSSANYEKIKSVLEKLEKAAYNKTSPTNAVFTLDFTSEITETLDSIKKYGCWCYLDSDYVKAKGAVQDSLDQECKLLNHGYKCLVIDGLDNGQNCDPLTQEYIEFDIFRGTNDVVEDCTRMNRHYSALDEASKQCAVDLCIVDGQFALNLFGLVTGLESETVFDPMMSHENYFDPSNECHNVDGQYAGQHGRSGRSTCGKYPNRYLFKTLGGERACCGDRTYSAFYNFGP